MALDPSDLASHDELVPQLHWYHTSTQPDWPTKNFDPAAGWDQDGVKRMGGQRHVDAWVARQRAKALHVGTYEAAIHNMFRRIDDQGDAGSQFYLYRVRLAPGVVVQADWTSDPGGLVGDVPLAEVCPPGVDVARYVNEHEDSGRLSLALGRTAIGSVQRIAVPIIDDGNQPWIAHAVDAIETAVEDGSEPTRPLTKLERFRGYSRRANPRAHAAGALVRELADRLPIDLRERFRAAVALESGTETLTWAQRVSGLYRLIDAPHVVLSALDEQMQRPV